MGKKLEPIILHFFYLSILIGISKYSNNSQLVIN